ncbi:2-polyprenyl-6-methoxyphenol hydroxylase-like FAD-dependent oxidoreductase [Bradyrhizobium sp. USDA 4501]
MVGAGPTGLLLAIELTLGGADVIVIERLTEPDQTIKAGAIGALAGEALERRGLGDAMNAVERSMADSMSRLMKGAGDASELPFKKFGGHFSGIFLIDQTRQREPDRRLRGGEPASPGNDARRARPRARHRDQARLRVDRFRG